MIPIPMDDGGFGGGGGGEEGWRERERRQRSLRMLLMFLTMLLLMEGDDVSRKKQLQLRPSRASSARTAAPRAVQLTRAIYQARQDMEKDLWRQQASLAEEEAQVRAWVERDEQRQARRRVRAVQRLMAGGTEQQWIRKSNAALAAALLQHDVLLGNQVEEEGFDEALLETAQRKTHKYPKTKAAVNDKEEEGGDDEEKEAADMAREEEDAEEEDDLERRTDEYDDDDDDDEWDKEDAAAQEVLHYPRNVSGFYRGSWERIYKLHNVVIAPGDGDFQDSRDENPHQVLAAALTAQDDFVGVQLLPTDYRINRTSLQLVRGEGATKREEAEEEEEKAASSGAGSLRGHRTPRPSSASFPLRHDAGRVALKLFYRPVPSMTMVSLVHGYVKMYDVNVHGFVSAGVLLRVHGVYLPSVGRLSLVANDGSLPPMRPKDDWKLGTLTRSALVWKVRRDDNDKNATETATTPTTQTTTGTVTAPPLEDQEADENGAEEEDEEEEEEEDRRRRRRLQQWKDEIRHEAVDSHRRRGRWWDELREWVWDEFFTDTADAAKWQLFVDTSQEEEVWNEEDDAGGASGTRTLAQRVQNWWKGWWTLPSVFESGVQEEEEEEYEKPSHRRLSEKTRSSKSRSKGNSTKVPKGEAATAWKDAKKKTLSTSRPKSRSSFFVTSPDGSVVLIPYPFVPEEDPDAVWKRVPTTAKPMSGREEELEAQTKQCEFSLQLQVARAPTTVEKWRLSLARHFQQARELDPTGGAAAPTSKQPQKRRRRRSDDEEEEEEEEEDNDDDDTGKDKLDVFEELATTKSQRRRLFLANGGRDASTAGTTTSSSSSSSSSTMTTIPVVRDERDLVMTMNGTLVSRNCGFGAVINATAFRTNWDLTASKAINYSFYMMLTCLTQIVVLLRQLLHSQSQSTAVKVSLVCIGWQTVLDAILCVGHILLCLVMHPLFTAFASVAFFKLLIFCVIEMKYMAIILQARNNATSLGNSSELLRRQVALLHVRFYVALCGALALLGVASHSSGGTTLYLWLLYSFWVPQIVWNMWTESKRPLHPHYIYGMSVTRLVAPLYLWGYGPNFWRLVDPDFGPQYGLCQGLVLWVALQTAILGGQAKFGARFLIPKRFLPPKYNYHRAIPACVWQQAQSAGAAEDSAAAGETTEGSVKDKNDSALSSSRGDDGGTVVGLESLGRPRHRMKRSRGTVSGGSGSSGDAATGSTTTFSTFETPQEEESALSSSASASASSVAASLDCVICYNSISLNQRRGYMLAPCNHIFHQDCLEQWMEVKMECPICRTDLPPL